MLTEFSTVCMYRVFCNSWISFYVTAMNTCLQGNCKKTYKGRGYVSHIMLEQGF